MCTSWVSNVILLTLQAEMVEIKIEVHVVLLVMVAIISIEMVVDVMVPIAPQVVVMDFSQYVP